MITWMNIMDPKMRYKQNKKAVICLRKNHKIITVGQLREFIGIKAKQINRKCTSNISCIKWQKEC